MRHLDVIIILLLTAAAVCPGQDTSAVEAPAVHIHYLGHASFFLRFGNDISVLTDYGQSRSYGLDSPICDLSGVTPDVVTISHSHADHQRPGMDFGEALILTGTDSLNLKGLRIRPIPTSEASLSETDNTSYLFIYKGLKILHLADAQAIITAIDADSVKQLAGTLYPDTYDLLLLTIQGVTEFIPQAETFLDLLHPRCTIPMHYWSPAYKAGFLDHLESQNRNAGRHYHIEKTGSADFILTSGKHTDTIRVISMEPAAL